MVVQPASSPSPCSLGLRGCSAPRHVALGTHEPPAAAPLLRGRPTPAATRGAVGPPPAAPSPQPRPREPPVQPPPRGLRRHRPSARPEGGGADELGPASRWRPRHRLLVPCGLLLLRAAHPAPRPAQGLRGLETESARRRAGPRPTRAGAERYPGQRRARADNLQSGECGRAAGIQTWMTEDHIWTPGPGIPLPATEVL